MSNVERFIILALFLPQLLASSCSDLKTCTECNSLLDSSGDQSCSWCTKTDSCVPNTGLECAFGTKISDVRDCPMEIEEGFEYNEKLSRKMLLVSAAAYADNPQVCISKTNPEITVLKQVTTSCDGFNDTCSALSAVSDHDNAIILGFRGTIGDVQLLLEAGYAVFESKCDLFGGGKVCKYFYNSFYSVWNGGMKDELERMKNSYPTYELWVTGHSMGAALAAIAANIIGYTNAFPVERLKLISFGEPRVGDKDWVKAHDNLLPYTYRVTHDRDIVTHIPPKDMLGYHHHRHEVWYENNMTVFDDYVICLSPEDKECSDQNWIQTSAMDHRFYFGIDILDIIDNGCQP